MAHLLVTQVKNPDEVELQSTRNQVSAQARPKSRWQRFVSSCGSCWSAVFCHKCCNNEVIEQTQTPVAPPQPVVPQADVHRDSVSLIRKPGKYLLPDLLPKDRGKKTLVLDLDETLVHSSFKPVPNADFVISIELEGEIHHVYVLKRPGVDEFLRACAEKFEIVVFTASLAKYADPLLDILDPQRLVRARLFREACVQHYGNYVKDLSQMGRELNHITIIDNSPYSYIFQPDNAIPITSWFNDPEDRELMQLMPLLDAMAEADNVCTVIQNWQMQHMQAQSMYGQDGQI
jgi:Dullard-like phosphatase family protein